MFKGLKKNRAQVFAEYAVILAIVVAVAGSMTFFVKRLIQARIKDANNKLYSVVQGAHSNIEDATIGNYLPVGEVPYAYEPYYFEYNQEVNHSSKLTYELYRGGTYGGARKIINETTNVMYEGIQLPPGAGSEE